MSITMRPAISAQQPLWSLWSLSRHTLWLTLLLLVACGGGDDSGAPPNTPLTTPMAMVANQDDTTMTTVRLDGKGSPVISTLSLGPVQADAIGGVTFSLGEWIFVTHTAGNRVAFIDPIGSLAPILEDYLDDGGDPKVGQRPKRIYRDPVDKEVLWTMNEGDGVTEIDTVANCLFGGSVTVLHNSHISVGGGKPHIKKTSCLFGKGEEFAASSRPTIGSPGLLQRAFVSSKTTGLITVVTGDPTDGANRWSTLIPIDLCDNTKETCDVSALTPNSSAPAGMFWSQATGKIYSYLSGYGTVVEIDPSAFAVIRKVDIAVPAPSTTVFHSVGITPDGRFLLLVGEDLLSDPSKVIGKFGVVDLTAAVLSITLFPIPELDNLRPAFFQFTPDGKRLYLSQSNKISDLAFGAQAHNLKLDRLLAFDPSMLPTAPAFVAEVSLPAAEMHGMDLWITGPKGAGSAKGLVVTNATPDVRGSVSLIDATSHTITATIPVGKNPKQVTVYYVGLAASDNQATPTW
jgi:YVTN family beta-propeller protein